MAGVDKSRLDPRRLAALDDLFGGAMTDAEVASKHNVSRACISLWKKDPLWIEEWNDRVASIQSLARQRILAKTDYAVDVLHEIMQNPDAQDKDRLKAVEMALKLAGMEPATKVDISGKLETTPDAESIAAERAAIEAARAELDAELAALRGE